MDAILQKLESRFEEWLQLSPRLEASQREYLSAHAYCALSDAAQLTRDWWGEKRTVDGLQRRYGRTLSVIDCVDGNMPLEEFVAKTVLAYNRWHGSLIESRPDRRHLAYVVRTALFEGNEDGWNRYVEIVRVSVPWFDADRDDENDRFRPRDGLLKGIIRSLFE